MGRPSLLAFAAALLLAACDPVYPGEPVGSFDVTGRLEGNTCGPDAVPARNPLSFAVELRRRDGEAFWRRPERPVVSGVVTPEGSYDFVTHSKIDLIAPDPDFGVAGCALTQIETVSVSLDQAAASPDGGLEPVDGGMDVDGGATPEVGLQGSNSIELTPTPGSDCTAATLSAGGPFLALPCRVDYALEGSARDAF